MDDIELIIPEREADIGNFRVGRLLPFRAKRAVGPFVFIDHMGPVTVSPEENFDVLPHPHIGLSTLTYLLDGSIIHRDSIGSEVEINPGEVNWMTAGNGVVHSERSPSHLRNSPKSLHGLQIWVALPRETEEIKPSFSHFTENRIPTWEENQIRYKLIAGEVWGKKSPVPVHSRLYFLEIRVETSQKLQFDQELYGEWALLILDGAVSSGGNNYGERQLLIVRPGASLEIEAAAGSLLFILGGEPFPEKRFLDWNFVSSRRERLQQAKEDWINQRFPEIDGETEFVPYPGTH